ncbi:hypothetical protein [Bacillus sp. REN16]|uniref:hypothetical protein n=1 Tax=Bacillus sp. REN16 TaxID=2887296 RepID=UPI001E35D750|nr:hypothetical protein [Bacillus sp. REN16]MCC3357009.1 hypothetical protein [Bacillus sp. REN16]
MNKGHIFLWILMIFATALGIYGQSFAYFLENITNTGNVVYYLTAITVISILLYLVTPLLAYLMIKLEKMDYQFMLLYIFIFGIIGVFVSLWSVFVCVMWWG